MPCSYTCDQRHRRALPLLVPVAAELAFELRLELAVDQHVQHLARLVRAVAPRVVRAALDDYVASFEVHVLVIEQHHDFAFQHHRVIDRLRAVHERMAVVLAEGRRVLGPHRLEHFFRLPGIHVPYPLGLGRYGTWIPRRRKKCSRRWGPRTRRPLARTSAILSCTARRRSITRWCWKARL